MQMNNCQVESGLQFLTRVKSVKSNLNNLENNLFGDKLKISDNIELSAESNFCKILMLNHFIKKAVLLDTYKDVTIGGLNTSVLFIDTEFHFQIYHFSQYIKRHLQNLKNALNPDDESEIIKNSLENLQIIRCYDSQQLLVTFYSLNTLLTSNPKIKFIIIDSIGANYWQDFMNGGLKKMDLYEKKVLSVFFKCIKDFKLLSLYCRPEYFVSKNSAGSATANFKVRLHVKDDKKSILEAVIFTKGCSVPINKSFLVQNGDIVWL